MTNKKKYIDIKMSRQKFSIFKQFRVLLPTKYISKLLWEKRKKHENITRKITVKPFGSYAVK